MTRLTISAFWRLLCRGSNSEKIPLHPTAILTPQRGSVRHGQARSAIDRTDCEARSPRHTGPRLLGYCLSRLVCAINRARVRFLCERLAGNPLVILAGLN